VIGTGPGGSAAVGDTVVTVGIVNAAGGNTAGVSTDFGAPFSVIYALSGSITSIVGGTITVSFDPSTGGTGVGRIYDRTGLGGINGNDASTWYSAIGTFEAQVEIAARPDALEVGAPGPPTTQAHALLGPNGLAGVNTSTANPGAAFGTVNNDFKFDITDFGSFFADSKVDPTGTSAEGLIQISDAFMVSLPQLIDPQTLAGGGVFTTPDIDELNEISQAFLGIDFATGFGGAAGSDYTLNGGLSGDGAARNQGGQATPGGQFVIPEPVSLLVWCGILISVGSVVGRRRR
jgi:hypothetical protein